MYYVMSDIHGQYDTFMEMLSVIEFSRCDKLCVLGDAIDRGPDGIKLLRCIMAAENITMILGNHENMLFDAVLRYPGEDCAWYHNNGCEPTRDAYNKLRREDQVEILRYIANIKLQHTVTVAGKRYTLVHGRPLLTSAEEDPLYDSSNDRTKYMTKFERRIWAEFVPGAIKREGTTFVFGHRMTAFYQDNDPLEAYFGDDCIGIDCDCAIGRRPGRLCCLRLDDLQTFYADIQRS